LSLLRGADIFEQIKNKKNMKKFEQFNNNEHIIKMDITKLEKIIRKNPDLEQDEEYFIVVNGEKNTIFQKEFFLT